MRGALLKWPLLMMAAALSMAACSQRSDPPDAPPKTDIPVSHTVGVLVPAGPFIMGSDRVDADGRAEEFGTRRPWYLDEHPRRTVTLGPLLMDRYEVTETQYATFVDDIKYDPPPHWEGTPPAPKSALLPVVNVNWMDAQNYCHWRGARLPTEAEWEKAARGTNGQAYPWGNDFDENKANMGKHGGVVEVGHYTESASPYHALDMAGNVWEWVADWYQPYPGNPVTSPMYGHQFKVLRGGGAGSGSGHYALAELTARSSYRFPMDPRNKVPDVGFRCVVALNAQDQPIDDHQATLHGQPPTGPLTPERPAL